MDGRAFALDYGSVMALAGPLGVDLELLATVLPTFDAIIINALNEDAPVADEEEVDG